MGDDGGDDGSAGIPVTAAVRVVRSFTYPAGSLWLALAMTNDPTYGNMAGVTVNGTTNDTWYEILSKQSLSDPQWWSEGSLQGVADQAVSQTSMTAAGGVNTSVSVGAHPPQRLGGHLADLVAAPELRPHRVGSQH